MTEEQANRLERLGLPRKFMVSKEDVPIWDEKPRYFLPKFELRDPYGNVLHADTDLDLLIDWIEKHPEVYSKGWLRNGRFGAG